MLSILAAINIAALVALIHAHPVEAFIALGAVLNVLNAALPATIRTGPVGTALHVLLDRVVILTRRDAPGTLKWPIVAGSLLRAVADSLDPPTRADEVDLRVTVAPPPPAIAPRDGQRGSVELGAMAYVAVVLALAVAAVGGITQGCTPPTPPSDGGVPVVTPSDWTRTAHLSVTVGRGLIVVARPIVDALTVDPGQTRARRAFDAADDSLVAIDHALSAYEARGGDRCAAYAAVGASVVALHELAQVLADNGIALGVPIGRVVDLVASVADTLVPACQPDAGFASAGQRANDELRAIEQGARVRGVILRRDLDGIAPALDGGVR